MVADLTIGAGGSPWAGLQMAAEVNEELAALDGRILAIINWTNATDNIKTTGEISASEFFSGQITISDDSVGDVPTPNAGGFVFIFVADPTYPALSQAGILLYDTGGSLSLLTVNTQSDFNNMGTTTLTGTTGTNGDLNVAVKAGNLVVENRAGGIRRISYTFIGGYHV